MDISPFLGLLTFSEWIGIIHGSHAMQWPLCKAHNKPKNEEGNVGFLRHVYEYEEGH